MYKKLVHIQYNLHNRYLHILPTEEWLLKATTKMQPAAYICGQKTGALFEKVPLFC
jgi:hypothetical protein